MLSASFGCISYLRGIFPDDNFSEERYFAKPTPSSNQKLHGAPSDSGQRLMRLKRGFSTEATALLDYLENGVYDALKQGYLKSVVFSVSLDAREPSNVHEAYTFQFSYSGALHSPSLLIQDVNRGRTTTLLPLDAARRSMQQLFRQLITMTQSLAPLPEDINKYLAIRLFFNESTPDDYQPPDFRAASLAESARFVTRFENDRPHDQEIGSLNTGFHACTLKISTIGDLEEGSGRGIEDIKFWDAEHNAKMVYEPQAISANHFQESYRISSPFEPNLKDGIDVSSIIQASQSCRLQLTQVMTPCVSQLSDQMQETRLRDGKAPESRQEGLISGPSVSATIRADEILDGLEVPNEDVQRKVSSRQITRATQNLATKFKPQNTETKRRDSPGGPHEDQVSCECGDSSDDGTMVQCDTCQGWSHLPCYGHIDSTIEEGYSHTCYTCRIRSPEELETFRSLAIVRRALHGLWLDGYIYTSTKAFGEAIGVKDMRTASGILQRLVNEGWLAKVNGKTTANKRGPRSAKKKPNYEFIRTPANEKRMLSDYFDPQRGLVQFPKSANNEANRTTIKGIKSVNSVVDSTSQRIQHQRAEVLDNSVVRDSCGGLQTASFLGTGCAQLESKESARSQHPVAKVNEVKVNLSADQKRSREVLDIGDTTDEEETLEDRDLGGSKRLQGVIVQNENFGRRSSARLKRLRVSISSKPIIARPFDI